MSLSCKELKKEYKILTSLQEEFGLSLKSVNMENLDNIFQLRDALEHQLIYLRESLPNIPSEWKAFYQTEFNLDLRKIRINIPEKQEGFDRLIIIAQNLTPNQAYEACARHFPCYRYTDDLNKEITTNDREPTQPYAIWVRDNQESDSNLKNQSADQIKKQNLKTETMTERLIHELKYFKETNKHLDTDTITLCSGSRGHDGVVPYVYWSGDSMDVDWYSPDDSGGHLYSRQVVS